jgi:hypothetical protein
MRLTLPILLSLFALGACSSDGGDGGSGAQPPDTQSVDSLTNAQRAAVCDWLADLWGGYGKIVSCGSNTLSDPVSQSDCIAKFPTCTATVGEMKACNQAIAAAQCDVFTSGFPQECTSLPAGCLTSG